MKTIIIILLLSINVYAVNYKAVGKNNTVYLSKALCAVEESVPECFEKKEPYYIVGLIDDLASPKFLKQDIEVCADFDSCQLIHATKDCSAFTDAFSVIGAGFDEVYCAEPNGFNQKPGLVVDAALKAAFDANLVAEAAEKASKDTKGVSREASLVTCAKSDAGSMSAIAQKECIIAISKELMKDNLTASEL